MELLEYKIEKINKKDMDETLLNFFGDQGWELIDMDIESNQIYVLIFKREKQ